MAALPSQTTARTAGNRRENQPPRLAEPHAACDGGGRGFAAATVAIVAGWKSGRHEDVAAKKMSSRLASAPTWSKLVRSSSIGPKNRCTPPSRIKTCVHRSSTIASMCELIITAAPCAARSCKRPLEDADSLRVETRERLVEEDGLRIVQVGAADGELLPHAAREVAGRRAEFRGQLKLVEQSQGLRLCIAHSVDAGVERQVLFDGQVVKQGRVVGHEGQSRLGGDRIGIDIKAGDRQPSAAGRNDSRDRPHRGRLAGAVGPDDGQQFARLDAKGNALDGDLVGKRLMEIIDFDHGTSSV